MEPVYLDYPATTPVDPRVRAAMEPYFTRGFANSSSAHGAGRAAREAVERAREQVAALLGARPGEVVFTSGATESVNLALQGAPDVRRVITCSTEHPAVLDTCAHLQRGGAQVVTLPPRPDGQLELRLLEEALEAGPAVVALMAANNETGVLHPLAEVGASCRARGARWVCDAAQACGKIHLDVRELGIDLLALSGHKLYGPKGVGALYVREGLELSPLLHGGGQEKGLRPGTLDVPSIVGLGVAAQLAAEELDEHARRIRALRESFWDGLQARIPGVRQNGHPSQRLPGILSVSFDLVDAEELVDALADEVWVSAGSACAADRLEPSHVMAAMGVGPLGGVRFGFGRPTTSDEVQRALERTVAVVERLRG
jgi:cysteine desulfurase